MSIFGKAKKCDLKILAEELGEKVKESDKLSDLRRIILASKEYDEDCAKEWLEMIMNERKNREEEEVRKRQEELELAERKRQEELAERKRQEELELAERKRQEELAERKRKDEMEFELQKLRIEMEIGNTIPIPNQNITSTQIKPKLELHHLIQKFNPDESDIGLYLTMFERLAKQADVLENTWVTHLMGLLPYDVAQLIARETDDIANNYSEVKKLLLKRYKLTPEKFRQKFFTHNKNTGNTWKNFAYELKSYFNEWIKGVKVDNFEKFADLMIADQMKRKVSQDVRDHFIDDWPKLISPDDLAEKLDDYDTLRSTFKNKQPRKDGHFQKNDSFKNDLFVSNIEKRRLFSATHNEKGEPKCFNCNFFGHISKDCPHPKVVITCRKCGNNGHKAKYCTTKAEYNNSNEKSMSVAKVGDRLDECTKYLKEAKINGYGNIKALIDTGSSCCLLRVSAAQKLGLKPEPVINELYGLGSQITPAVTTLGKIEADLEVDSVKGQNIKIYIIPDLAQPVDLLIGRSWLDLPHIAYARIGNTFHIAYREDEPFSNLIIDKKVDRICLKTLKETKLEKNTVNLVSSQADNIDNGLILIENTTENIGYLLKVEDGKVQIPMMNAGQETVMLLKDQCVSRAEIVNIDSNTEHTSKVSNSPRKLRNLKQMIPITLNEIKTDPTIECEKKQELLNLLNDFRDCFALNISELGCTNLTEMDIKEIEGSKPICMKPYQTNASQRAAIKEIVNEWKENGIVTETRSPYASPVILVKKKTGENRLVIDYRRLNNQTVKDKFPLPKIDDLLEQLHECNYFTTLDLAHGYLQIPLTKEAKLKSAFITPDETGQFERMIFGLTNAPAEFQRLMYHALGSLYNRGILCYLDDILIPAKTWNDMIEKLTEVLEALRLANLTLKLPKCEFGKQEVEYLGFIINQYGIKPGTRKVEAISKFPQPKNIHEVRRFLGLTSFFRRFIPNYATKARFLTQLTKKNEKFKWEEGQKESFDTLKRELTNQPILALYNPEAETEVHCDACADGIAGMLLQRGSNNKLHLVYCVSKKTTEIENKYHSSKLELMAIVWTLERLRQFLLGINFTVVTDCQALIYMNAKKSSNPQIARWSLLIQEFNFEIRHRPGTKMSHVDAISRAPVLNSTDTLDSLIENKLEVCLSLSIEDQVLMMQQADDTLKELIAILKKEVDERTKEETNKISNYVLKGNRLFRVIKEDGNEKLLFVLPKSMRKSTVVKFHDLMGHFAVDKTVSKIKELYWFPSMKRYVRRHISMCFECLVNKIPGGKRPGLLHSIPTGRRPFAIVHLDHLGPFITSSKKNKELLVVIDNMTRFVRLYPVRDTSTKNVLKSLTDFVQHFGLPDRLISDRGSCFTSHEFQKFCDENGILHTLNSTSHPQGNGMVERINRTILSTIPTSMESINHKDWDNKIKEVERNLNNTVNKTLGKTPFEILHGYVPRFKDGLLRLLADEDAKVWNDPEKLQHKAKERIEKEQLKMKEYYDKKKSGTLSFDKGEIVVVRRNPKATGESTKTQPRYRGPMVVTEVLPGDTYRISQLEETSGHLYATTAHVSQLKAWKSWNEEEDDLSADSEEELESQRPKRTVRKPLRYGNV